MANEQVQGMAGLIENLWSCFDELFASIDSGGAWGQKHGDDWTYADVPYHMAYFDRVVVADAIERGTNVPAAEQRTQRTMRQLNDWNAAEFAKRAAGQTPQQSMAVWQEQRDRIRALTSKMDDANLMDPGFVPLFGCGFLPAAASLGACIAHGWSEFTQLSYLNGDKTAQPMPYATHAALGFFQNFLPVFMNRDAAKGVNLTVRLEYTGPGGGVWTARVADGGCTVAEEANGTADMTITQSPQTSELLRQKKLDPMQAMQSGAMKVEGLQHMETFGQLFAEPSLDMQMEPMSPGAAD